MPLVLLLVLAAPIGLLRLYVQATQRGLLPAPPVPAGSATAGAAGLGDPYYPRAGNSGYDVAKYTIAVSWDPGSATLTGTTTFSARALQALGSFYVDLALQPREVSVDGTPATFARQGSDVRITPARPVAAGADFWVTVRYAGRPGEVRVAGTHPWWTTGQEWTAAGEPQVAAWWFPANDHPSDPALMDVSVRVPAGLEAVSVGRLESRDTGDEAGFDTWHWVSVEPMATYLNFLSIGQYVLDQGVVDGRPYVYAVSEQLDAGQRRAAFAQLLTSAAKVRVLAGMFGPYPFTELGGVVPAHRLEFDGLENQTRPVYNAASILDARFATELLTHELAHMWFGDNVTVRQWDDIFDSEGYASWAAWAYAERTGGPPARERLLRAYDRLRDRPAFWRITMTDPGRRHLFDAVYARGPMALEALRRVVGDDAFLALSREWAQSPGSRSLAQWRALAQSHTPVDLDAFFTAWLDTPRAPARTAANGLA